jgi:hypothetical protein
MLSIPFTTLCPMQVDTELMLGNYSFFRIS